MVVNRLNCATPETSSAHCVSAPVMQQNPGVMVQTMCGKAECIADASSIMHTVSPHAFLSPPPMPLSPVCWDCSKRRHPQDQVTRQQLTCCSPAFSQGFRVSWLHWEGIVRLFIHCLTVLRHACLGQDWYESGELCWASSELTPLVSCTADCVPRLKSSISKINPLFSLLRSQI